MFGSKVLVGCHHPGKILSNSVPVEVEVYVFRFASTAVGDHLGIASVVSFFDVDCLCRLFSICGCSLILVTGIGENLPRFIIDNIDAVLATIIDGHIENIIKTTVSKNINDGIAAVWNNTYVLEPYGVSFSYALSKFPVHISLVIQN